MPIYLYFCPQCTQEYNVLKKMSSMDDEEHCKTCKGRPLLVRKVAKTAFTLKGGGWYADGYNKKSN